jgi:hypothetical protein
MGKGVGGVSFLGPLLPIVKQKGERSVSFLGPLLPIVKTRYRVGFATLLFQIDMSGLRKICSIQTGKWATGLSLISN